MRTFADGAQLLVSLLPPKKEDLDPQPAVVDDAKYEESDLADVRARSFPPGFDFFHHGAQFGEGDEDGWEDEDEDEDEMHMHGEPPECRQQ